MTFAPKHSWGWVWPLLVAALASLPFWSFAFDEVAREEVAAVWITLVIVVPLVIYMLLVVITFPTLRYELADDELQLIWWPMRYRVPYADIIEIRREDLVPSLWSSMRFPGLALGKVPYTGRGTITMCSTRAAHGVLIIRTAKRDFGISPAEESAFVEALVARVPALPSPVLPAT